MAQLNTAINVMLKQKYSTANRGLKHSIVATRAQERYLADLGMASPLCGNVMPLQCHYLVLLGLKL
jgi:hypothetical protein